MAEATKSVYVAIAVDVGIAISKFVAAGFSGSSGMLTEGIHSVVDAGIATLLLVGMARSRKPADAAHPFGYAQELYFWTTVVALLLFAAGGGMSAYEGVNGLLHPKAPEAPYWNYAVLVISAALGTYSLAVSRAQLLQSRPGEGLWRAILASKDPRSFSVLLVDIGDLIGVSLAFLGVLLSQVFDSPYPDPIAALGIGLVLAGIAAFLANESRHLLIGESVDPALRDDIRALAEAEEAVAEVRDPLTMQLGPDEVMLAMGLRFREGLATADLERSLGRVERAIRAKHPKIRRIFLEIESDRRRADGPGTESEIEPEPSPTTTTPPEPGP